MTVRELTKQLVGERDRILYGRCEWCGAPCYGRACVGHKDLSVAEHEVIRAIEKDGAQR